MYLKLFIAFTLSLSLILILMPSLINYLKSISFNQTVNEYALQEYKEKAKTPTMGGILFVLIPVIVTLIMDIEAFTDLDTFIVMMAYVAYGLIGFLDDYLIVVRRNNDGLKAKYKFILQLILAIVFFILYVQNNDLVIIIPIIKYDLYLGFLYPFLIFIMFTGSSNAVNLTDGMDGLAAGCMVFALIPFIIFSVLYKNTALSILLVSILGSLIGYLKYNITPAKVYMGDTGSLALGALLAATAMVLKSEVLLIIVGGVFIWETLCVIIQISSVKLRGKRVFRYTPIHYSFVLDGMSEKSVVKSFWLLSAICCVVGLVIGLI